ncbi:MAG: hypothetical protein RL522_58 [Pseudomonadota bacterium]
MNKSEEPARLMRALWLAVGALLLLRLAAMALIPLMDTTEARYGEIARKMVTLNDWITPWHDHGQPFWGKPPLSFWLTALSFKLLGVHEFSARLPHLLCGLLTAACIWNVARVRATSQGSIAVAILAGGLLFHVSSGAVMTDSALVLGTTAALCSAWLALTGATLAQRTRHAWLTFLATAVAVLAKGPLALVLIGAPMMLWALWCGRWRALWQALPWVRGVVLLAVLCLPWFVVAERKTPGFFEYFIVGEHFHRFVTPGWRGDLYGNAHAEPKGKIWLFAAGAMLPWALLLPALAFWRRASPAYASPEIEQGPWQITDRETGRWPLLMALVPLVFFSASSNIIWTYALPALPGLAWWAARWMGRNPVQGLRWAVAGAAGACAVMAVALIVAGSLGRFERSTGKAMVARCESERTQRVPAAQQSLSDPIVMVLGRRSLSADFYSAGRAPRVQDLREAAARVPPAGGCLALSPGDVERVEASGLQIVQNLGLASGQQILWVRAAPGAK